MSKNVFVGALKITVWDAPAVCRGQLRKVVNTMQDYRMQKLGKSLESGGSLRDEH